MTHFDFVPYFKNIAEKLKELQHTTTDKHFHRIVSISQMEEFLQNMRSTTGYQLLVMDHVQGRMIDRDSDNLLDRPYYSFYVMKNVEHGNYDARQQAIQDCKTVAKKILSKLFYDRFNAQNGLNFLDRNSITYQQSGPYAHNWFGINYNFTLLDPANIIYNADDWNE